MSDKYSLVNLGDISKPASILIEKISDAIGAIYEPKRIVKKAEAEAEAKKILAKADIEIEKMQERAITRLIVQQTKKQANIEKITKAAILELPEDAQVENLEEDWIIDFFSKCENVSDEEMQTLWAKILSGEATKPGSFSKRTVLLVSTLDKRDAELFAKLSQFIWFLDENIPLIFDHANPIYTKAGINFEVLQHLDSIGLATFNTITGYIRQGYGKRAFAAYNNQGFLIEFNQDTNNQISTGQVLLTSIGKELLSICASQPNKEFEDFVLNKWGNENLKIKKV